MLVWLVIFAGLLIIQYLLLLFFMGVNWKNHYKNKGWTPKVSVLVAARNEEMAIPALLNSLSNLYYPVEKLEILIADDQSEDQTPQLAADWVKEGINRKLISIQTDKKSRSKKNGKANALAILSEHASGEFLSLIHI